MRRVVFLDKDGTLIENVPYNADPAQIRLEKTRYGVDRGLRICDEKNQSTVVRFNLPRLQ